MTNPLNKYFRVPKSYVKLPSKGRFYPDNFVETTANGEVAVYPLSAIDQILLKTPDAILNGDALLKVVKNCVPGVVDVKRLVEPDINTLLLAMRIASSGNTTEWTIACPKCNTEHAFEIDLNSIVETQSYIDEDPVILFNGELKIYIRPYDFEQRNLQLLNEIEEAQTVKLINSNQEADENEKIAQLSRHVDSMAQRTFDVVSLSIQMIEIVGTKERVTDRTYIAEFLKGITRSQADVIIESIRELNQKGINAKQRFTCTNCTHEWEQGLDFDPTSFFD
jgi:hypothetical protein